jgi:hypothetical protein
MNLYQAIILALDDLGGEGTIKEVSSWIVNKISKYMERCWDGSS